MMKSSVVAFVLFHFLFIAVSASKQSSNQVTFHDRKGYKVTITYVPVGCYKDSENYRIFRHLYSNQRPNIDWRRYPDFSYIIEKCAEKAYNSGYRLFFGVEFWGECWSDSAAPMRFNRLGKSNYCVHGVGRDWSEYVYHFSEIQRVPDNKCNVNGKEYNEGDLMLVSNDWDHVRDAKCLKCECQGGKARGCNTAMFCDTQLEGNICEEYKTPPGDCCPRCACIHQGKKVSPGDTWVVQQNGKCAECSCNKASVASCRETQCFRCSQGTVPERRIQPGKCCPKCIPELKMPRPTFIITTTTKRAPPVLPSQPRTPPVIPNPPEQ